MYIPNICTIGSCTDTHIYLDQHHRVEHWQDDRDHSTRTNSVERIHQPDIPLRGAVELCNLRNPKSFCKRRPDLWAEPVANAHSDNVLRISWSAWLSQKVATYLSDVESHLDVS